MRTDSDAHFSIKEHRKIMHNDNNQLILNIRRKPIRATKESLIREPAGATNSIFHEGSTTITKCMLCVGINSFFSFSIKKGSSNKHTINECSEIFHKAMNVDKVRLEETAH